MLPRRFVVFGNSGAGKSYLAKKLQTKYSLAYLDLDTVAWQPGITPPQRLRHFESKKLIGDFVSQNNSWVVEGCYSSLLSMAMPAANRMLFLNPGVDVCIQHCKARPLEEHKYKSKADQDKNLPGLLQWVARYNTRQDEYGLAAHRELFDTFKGTKRELTRGY